MKTMRMSILGCVVVLLVAGIVFFPETAFGLEVVVGCAGAPPVTGSAAVVVTMTDGQQMNLPSTTCSSAWSRRAATQIPSGAQVTGWTATLNVTGKSGTLFSCGSSTGDSLPARLTCKHDTDNVRLHVTLK